MLEALPRRHTAILLVALLVVLALVGKATRGSRRGHICAAGTARRDGAGLGASAPAARIVVDVVGAVRRAGLFRLPEGARVADAVAPRGRPDGEGRHRARQPRGAARRRPAGRRAGAGRPGSSGGEGPASGPGAKVSLANATVDELDGLPGIGPVTAQKIVDWRQAHGPFRSVDDLDAIPGIGPARVEQLRDLVTP